MPDREHLERLAALVASGEATPAERAELDRAHATDPALAATAREIETVDAAFRLAAQTPPNPGAALPPQFRARLAEVRREALTARLTHEPPAAVVAQGFQPVAGARTVVPFGETFALATRRLRTLPRWLRVAACVAALIGLALFLLPPRSKDVAPIAVLAPRGTTAHTQPTLVWDAAPNTNYDVWVLPAEGSHLDAPALFIAKNVKPPVAFSQLQPGPTFASQTAAPRELETGRDYRLLVCPVSAGRLAGTASPFHTSPNAAGPPIAPSLEKARQLASAGRVGDALMLLATLPGAERDSPAARALETDLRSKLPLPPSP